MKRALMATAPLSLLDDLEPPLPNSDRLRRADWTVGTCSYGEAARFVVAGHYSKSTSTASVYRHCVRRLGGWRIYGVAMWMPAPRGAAATVDPDNWRGVLTLSRLCVDPRMPTNSASFLLGASMRLINRNRWPTLLTYADTRYGHTGAIYRATNWTCLGEIDAGESWRNEATGEQRGRRKDDRKLTRAQMTEAGFELLPPMPKIKFVHRTRGARAEKRAA